MPTTLILGWKIGLLPWKTVCYGYCNCSSMCTENSFKIWWDVIFLADSNMLMISFTLFIYSWSSCCYTKAITCLGTAAAEVLKEEVSHVSWRGGKISKKIQNLTIVSFKPIAFLNFYNKLLITNSLHSNFARKYGSTSQIRVCHVSANAYICQLPVEIYLWIKC